jgi:Flp pilus assembly protein TadG
MKGMTVIVGRVASSRRATRRSERGAAFVELAVALPLLILVLVGTIDFARVFYMSIELTNAARAGAQFGAFGDGSNSSNISGMQSAATAAAPNLTGVTAQASRVCQCVTDTGTTFTTLACDAACGVGEHAVTSVTVTARQTFSTIVASFPGIPTGFTVERSATLRVAQ